MKKLHFLKVLGALLYRILYSLRVGILSVFITSVPQHLMKGLVLSTHSCSWDHCANYMSHMLSYVSQFSLQLNWSLVINSGRWVLTEVIWWPFGYGRWRWEMNLEWLSKSCLDHSEMIIRNKFRVRDNWLNFGYLEFKWLWDELFIRIELNVAMHNIDNYCGQSMILHHIALYGEC